MNSQIFIEIRDPDSLMALMAEARRMGLMKDIPEKDLERKILEKAYPIQVPVKLDGVIELCGNPILKKMFGRKLENGILNYLAKAEGAG